MILQHLSPPEALLQARRQLRAGDRIITIGPAFFKPSKGPAAVATLRLIRLTVIEHDLAEALAQIGTNTILKRARLIDPSISQIHVKPSVFVRAIDEPGPFLGNVFVPFPEAVDHISNDPGDHFVIEFADTWRAIIEQILRPIVVEVFDGPAITTFARSLADDATVVRASVAHEVGHHLLFVRVIPERDGRLRIDTFLFDAFAELVTDACGVTVFPEFDGIAEFNLLYRVFYYARKLFWQRPETASIATDNDALAGAFIWARMREAGAIGSDSAGAFTYDGQAARAVWTDITRDARTLLEHIIALPAAHQTEHVLRWFARYVPYDPAANRFLLSDELRNIFIRASRHAYVPVVQYWNRPRV